MWEKFCYLGNLIGGIGVRGGAGNCNDKDQEWMG